MKLWSRLQALRSDSNFAKVAGPVSPLLTLSLTGKSRTWRSRPSSTFCDFWRKKISRVDAVNNANGREITTYAKVACVFFTLLTNSSRVALLRAVLYL
jgi:hypothetical protein